MFEENSSCASIGGESFKNCTGLTSIEIPHSVTSIGGSAFSGCTGLTNIYYNATNCNDLSTGSSAFYNAGKNGDGITVTIGNNVTKIPAYLFDSDDSSCSPKLTSVVFEANSKCTSIGENAFSCCISLTSITIPDSVTSIGECAFFRCAESISITVSEGNTKYHIDGNCLIETETKTLILGRKNSTIPTDGSVTRIGDYAFAYCIGLTSITIPSSVTHIDYCAFLGCWDLTTIMIDWAGRLLVVESTAFNRCSSLTSIYYRGIGPDYRKNWIMGSYNSGLVDATWYYYSYNNPFEGENAVTEGNYWHYDASGNIVEWEQAENV